MAKVESRLPFLRSNKPKACQSTVYIIAGNDEKLSDYSLLRENTDKLVRDNKPPTFLPPKGELTSRVSREIKAPNAVINKKTAPLEPKNQSHYSKKASTAVHKSSGRPSGLPSQLRPPGTGTSVCIKTNQISQQNNSKTRPSIHSSSDAKISGSRTIQGSDTPSLSLNESKSSTTISNSAPVVPPKPLILASKISKPSAFSKLSPPGQGKAPTHRGIIRQVQPKFVNPGAQAASTMSAPIDGHVTRHCDPPKTTHSIHNSNAARGTVGTVSAPAISQHPLSKLSNATQASQPEGKTTAKLKKPSLIALGGGKSQTSTQYKSNGFSKSTGQLQKLNDLPSRLSAPSKNYRSQRIPSATNSSISPSTHTLNCLQQPSLLTTLTDMEIATELQSVTINSSAALSNTSHAAISVQLCPQLSTVPHSTVTQVPTTQVPVTQAPVTQAPVTQAPVTQVPVTQAPVTQVTVNHSTPQVYQINLYKASTVPSVNVSLASGDTIRCDKVQVDNVQTYCAPCVVDDVTDELSDTQPEVADAQVSQCYSYLQQATPSSFHKHLLNSFTIREQLSPTAESHARHIASSLPQPWLSADLIGDGDEPPQLIIPDPPEEGGTCKLQAIAEDVETVREGLASAVPSLPSVEETLVCKQSHKTPGLFGNLFSKIGGRRMLARPQESPPRSRRSTTLAALKGEAATPSTLNRRKLSPKTRRKEAKITRDTAQLQQKGSPKHKPVFQDDSPIRSKEAYYGGVHHHIPKPNHITQSKKENTSTTQRITAVEGDNDVFTENDMQLATAINGVRENSLAEHTDIYKYSYRQIRTLPLPVGRSSLTSGTSGGWLVQGTSAVIAADSMQPPSSLFNHITSNPAMASIPVMSRSLSHKKKHKENVDNGSRFKTNYSAALRMGLPPCPELQNKVLEQGSSALSKVTVAVRLKAPADAASSNTSSYITADSSRGQLILKDPSNQSNMAPSCRRQLAAVPKFFAFDKVFGADAMQMSVCKDTVIDILQSVLLGSDGCVISFGQNKTGKSRSLIGDDSSCADFGIIPAAISWLYHLIEQQKSKTGARFSIRISALDIRGRNEELTDLLAHCNPSNDGSQPAVYLTSTDVYGSQVENLNEMRAPDVDHAGHYLDAALTTSYNLTEKSENKSAHFLFTLHIYQHHLESKPSPGGALVAGGRSRLHFIDIGPCAKSSNNGSALTLASLGSAITALLNGQRQFAQKESKLATLLRDSVGHHNCRTCILVHISTQPALYSETLQILQLAARIHRMKVRRRNKIGSNSSDDTGSTNSNMRRRRGIRMGTSASLSDPDVSSSEQSIDTVIYVPGETSRPKQSNLYKANYTSKPHAASHQPPTSCLVNAPGEQQPSPYRMSGATKKRLSDDETSSEGRRRMPRTNARAWPRANHTDNEIWLDAAPTPPVSRDEWHIAGNAGPAISHNHGYYSNGVPQQHQPYQHSKNDQQNHYSSPMSNQPISWLPLAQYNGHPEHIGQLTTGGHSNSAGRQAWVETAEANGKAAFTEVSKQELWVDGPTAFRKNIEGLTHNLHKEQMSPSKRHQRHNTRNHSGDKGDKSKHHRNGSRKHKDNTKHCHQCGADIKKDQNPLKMEDKPAESKSIEEPTLSVKPFVKDWVLRHSKNNTPTKASEVYENSQVNGVSDGEGLAADSASRSQLVQEEVLIQEELQLTVDLDEELGCLPSLPRSISLMNDNSDMERQDGVHIDDSVSNVTADDKVGFESKEGSSIDESSLSEEVVEVCDAACQTEFTDSDSLSVQSNSNDISVDNMAARPSNSTIGKSFSRRDSTEAFLNSTLQGTLLRKPDGASDPSLHKELLSPSTERKNSGVISQPISSTLPRNAFLKSPKSNIKAAKGDACTIKLQPYLCSPKPSHTKPLPERTSGRPQSNLKKMGLSKQRSIETDHVTTEQPSTVESTKVKGSLLPSLRFSSKPKESKIASAQPCAPPKKCEAPKKEKRSLLQAPSKIKNMVSSDTKKQSSRIALKGIPKFDVTSSPYRQYVLPKPSYADSEVFSSSSSGPNKHSVSSGYESMTHHSTEDICQLPNDTTVCANDSKLDVWVESTSQPSSDVMTKLSGQKREDSQLSDNVTRQARLQRLLYLQNTLKQEMAEAKSRLMVPTSAWNYGLHEASRGDKVESSSYVEALERETTTLQRQVDACKSRIMLITSIF